MPQTLHIESQSQASDPLEEIAQWLDECTDNPHLFNETFLGGPSFWWRQIEMCRSVVDYRTTVVYSGNMIGKDFWVGRLIWWWLYTRTNDPLVVVTGPSQSLLGLVTWKEVRRAIKNAPLPPSARITSGAKTSPQQIDLGGGVQAVGYSTTSVERASGQHSGELLVIVEEASGVDDEIWEAIDSLGYDRLVCIGNPIRAEGRFVDLIRQAEKDRVQGIPKSSAVNAIRIPSTDSPHAEMEKSKWGLASKTWIDEHVRKYGKDSLWVRSHIRALIPEVSAQSLIPLPWLDWAAAQERDPSTLDPLHPAFATRRISGDLGEGVGRDSASVWVTDDYGVLEVVFGDALGLAETAYHYHRLGLKWGVPHERMSYDRLGIGREFHLHLARLGITNAVGYAGNGTPASGDFVNLRTEAAWRFRQRLDPQGATDYRAVHASRSPFVIPPGDYWPRLREELSKLTYHLVKTKIALLSKEDHAKILGHSPDLSDGLCQGFGFT